MADFVNISDIKGEEGRFLFEDILHGPLLRVFFHRIVVRIVIARIVQVVIEQRRIEQRADAVPVIDATGFRLRTLLAKQRIEGRRHPAAVVKYGRNFRF